MNIGFKIIAFFCINPCISFMLKFKPYWIFKINGETFVNYKIFKLSWDSFSWNFTTYGTRSVNCFGKITERWNFTLTIQTKKKLYFRSNIFREFFVFTTRREFVPFYVLGCDKLNYSPAKKSRLCELLAQDIFYIASSKLLPTGWFF